MKKIELLAPAGSIESLYAAVNSGADAVYLGGDRFSARAYASNFTGDKMAEAVRHCHIYGVKVHVTINTLIKDNEMKDALDYARFLYSIGVDALIIQDTGLALLLNNELPDFELHASTQMTVHNLEGALFLKSLGFKRVVLSRELSIEEIRQISEKAGIETEIFIHGALCICYSGQCLMSSLIGGRSGNRGRCAQPCRLPYTLMDNVTGAEKKAYVLSPKDICTMDSLKNIIDAGVSSLKIEGRMKRPEYVAGVAGAYRKALESIYENKDFDIKEQEQRVLQLFNREGASKAYLFGNWGADMMAYSNPKNTGLKLGTADESLNVKLLLDLSLKDGISVGETGFAVSKLTAGNRDLQKAVKGETVKIFPLKYKKGDVLYKTSDNNLLEELGKAYEAPYVKKVDVFLKVYFESLKQVKVIVDYKGQRFEVLGETVQTPKTKPVEQSKFVENISKTQNTPFNFKVHVDVFEPGFIPVSSINEIRRAIIEKIYELESGIDRVASNIEKAALKKSMLTPPENLTVVCTNEQLKAALDSGIENIAVDIFLKGSDIEIPKSLNFNLYLRIPNIIKEEYEEICKIIDENMGDISGLVTGNLGIIGRYCSKTRIIGDYKLNIFNKNAVEFYAAVSSISCLSVELNKSELKDILRHCTGQILLYGKIELMVSEYCMAGSMFGGKSKTKACSAPCSRGRFMLKDRKGFEFRVLLDKYCRSHIYNNSALNLIPNLDELSNMGAKHFRLDFTDEDYNETKKIIESFKKGSFEYSFENYTRGHYKRGVE